MLPKNYRFSLKSQKKKDEGPLGERFRGPLFNLLITRLKEKGEKLPTTQFAFVVSSQIAKKATERNRLKRLLAEAVGQLLPQTQAGFCVAIFAGPTLAGKPLVEIKAELEKAFLKTGLIKN